MRKLARYRSAAATTWT